MADILCMRNGDRLTGIIKDITDEGISISLPYSQTMTIRRDAIKHWQLGTLEKTKPLTSAGIPLLSLPNEVNVWLWAGMIDLNIKLKESDKKTNHVNIKGSTEVANRDWRYTLNGEYIYETSNSVTDSHQYTLSPKLDFFFDANWFLRSSIDADYDMLGTNYLNLSYASGPGYRFWNDKMRRLELSTQLGLQRSYVTSDELLFIELFEDRIISYPIISLGWDYRQTISLWQQRFELFSKGNYGKFIDQPSPYLTRKQSVDGDLGLRYFFSDHLRLSLSSELNWEDSYLYYGGVLWEAQGNKEWRHKITLGASF